VNGITNLMNELGLNVQSSASLHKRIVFALDYSGSMSGMKINSAVDSILTIYDKHMQPSDELMLLCFNNKATIVVDMVAKGRDPKTTRNQINSQRSPNGGTALFDAIRIAADTLQRDPRDFTHWIVALTDGDDNESKITVNTLISKLAAIKKQYLKGVIIIGVGSDVKENVLKSVANATKKGLYIQAESDRDSISKAFEQVVKVIQAQVVIEDF